MLIIAAPAASASPAKTRADADPIFNAASARNRPAANFPIAAIIGSIPSSDTSFAASSIFSDDFSTAR